MSDTKGKVLVDVGDADVFSEDNDKKDDQLVERDIENAIDLL